MYVLEFLTKKEIEEIFDDRSRLVINYLLKKVLFSQPEMLPGEERKNIQMTKEFLENWVAQALGWKIIGQGNYPIDVYSKELKIGADVKFLSAKINNGGEYRKSLSNETSLSQKFKDTGKNLDQLFEQRNSKKILSGWIDILLKKNKKPIDDYKLDCIYYFIFIRGGSRVGLSVAKVNFDLINTITIKKLTETSAFFDGYIEEKYGDVKLYKSKKRMELRCRPSNLEIDNRMINWDFQSRVSNDSTVQLREIIKDKEKFLEHTLSQVKNYFDI